MTCARRIRACCDLISGIRGCVSPFWVGGKVKYTSGLLTGTEALSPTTQMKVTDDRKGTQHVREYSVAALGGGWWRGGDRGGAGGCKSLKGFNGNLLNVL